MSDGRAPRRCHSDRGILEQYDGKFIKASARHCRALPSVSVPYTFSAMTRPSLLRRGNKSRKAAGIRFVTHQVHHHWSLRLFPDWGLLCGLRLLTPWLRTSSSPSVTGFAIVPFDTLFASQ